MRRFFFPRGVRRKARSFAGLVQLEDRCTPALLSADFVLTPGSANNNGSIATGDFDKDGKRDAVVSNYGADGSDFASSVTVLFGTGLGGFTNTAAYSTGTGQHINFVAVADLNGDGYDDIVASSSNADSKGDYIVLLNTGIGTFQAKPAVYTGGNRATWVGIGDFDGDTIPDLAVTNMGEGVNSNIEGNNISFFKGLDGGNGKGSGTYAVSNVIEDGFALVSVSATILDINNDGDQDLVATVITADPESTIEQTPGKLAIISNDGFGVMTLGTTFPGTGAALPISVKHADINLDGKQDLLVANVGDPDVNGLYLNFGAGSGFTYLLGDGFGGFGNASKITTGIKSAWAVAPADFNLDGKIDVAIANYGSPFGALGGVVVYLGNGAGAFSVDPNSPYVDTSAGNQYLTVGDFDNKGTLDVVTVGDHNRVRTYVNTTRPTTTGLATTATELTPGQSVTFTATVAITSPYTEQPAGKVSFFDGATTLGTGTLALDGGAMKATFTTTTLANGAHSITARYDGASTPSYATGVSKSAITVVTVSSAPNTPPTIGDVTNQSVIAGGTVGPIAFSVADAETPAAALTLSAKSSNGGVIPAGNVVFTGSGNSRFVSVTAPAGTSGSSTITITVTDAGGQTASDTFDVVVGANTPPSISAIADRTVAAGTTVGPISFAVGDNESPATTLVLSGTSNNPALIENTDIVFGGSGKNRTVTVTTYAGFTGNATITVTVTDPGGLMGSEPFVITLTDGASVSSITSTSANGTYTTGQSINVTLSFSESVTLAGGNLNVTLDSGAVLSIAPFTGTSAAATYVVQAGQTSPDLTVTNLALAGGATFTNGGGSPVGLALPGSNLGANANLIVNPPPPTTVSFITVNNSSPQRSRITSLTLTFNNPVNAANFTGVGAITLTRTKATNQGAVGTLVQTGASGVFGRINLSQTTGLTTSLTLTFDNANGSGITPGVENTSLADGRWQLAIPSLGYTSTFNDPNLRRLFGDGDANGFVDGNDFSALGTAFNTADIGFDFDNNGVVDGIDFAQFGGRFSVTL